MQTIDKRTARDIKKATDENKDKPCILLAVYVYSPYGDGYTMTTNPCIAKSLKQMGWKEKPLFFHNFSDEEEFNRNTDLPKDVTNAYMLENIYSSRYDPQPKSGMVQEYSMPAIPGMGMYSSDAGGNGMSAADGENNTKRNSLPVNFEIHNTNRPHGENIVQTQYIKPDEKSSCEISPIESALIIGGVIIMTTVLYKILSK